MNSFSKLCCSFLFFTSYFSNAALIQIETSGNAKFQTYEYTYNGKNIHNGYDFGELRFESLDVKSTPVRSALTLDNPIPANIQPVRGDHCGDGILCSVRQWQYDNLPFSQNLNITPYVCELAGISTKLCPLNVQTDVVKMTMRRNNGIDVWYGNTPFYSTYTHIKLGEYANLFFNQDQILTGRIDVGSAFVLDESSWSGAKAPNWGQDYELPTSQQLVDFLTTPNKKGRYRFSISLDEYACPYALSSAECKTIKSTNYYFEQEVTFSLVPNAVSLPATASFLLLGVAGLALRRRLTA